MKVMITIINLLIFLLLSPLLEGVYRKVVARIQSRKGPPVIQPYYDLIKLMNKENFVSGNVIFRAAPVLAAASVISAIVMFPLGGGAGIFSGYGDIIAFIYLLTFGGVAVILGAIAGGNTYGMMGLSREMITMIMVEPILAMSLIMGGVRSGNLLVTGAVSGIESSGFNVSAVIMAVVFVLAFQAFAGIQPFDISEAEIEILEGPFIEYSGPGYGLFRYYIMLKRMLYGAIFTSVFLEYFRTGQYALDVLIQVAEIVIVYVAAAFIGATNPRLRIDQAVKYYSFLIVFSLGAVILSAIGI